MHITLVHIGLIFDVLGAVILYFYGLPSDIVNERGPSLIAEHDDKTLAAIQKHNARIKLRSRIGLSFIGIGFLLQLIGSL